jgi:hypothetical protein
MLIKIRLVKPRENQIRGFYLILTKTGTTSFKKDEYIIDKDFLPVLEENNIMYEKIE